MPFSIYGEKQLDLTSQYLDNPSLNYTAKDQISGPDSSDAFDDAGRSTCSRIRSLGSALGIPMAVLREWMLVLDDVTVETYAKGEANFMPRPMTSQLLDFLKGLN